MSEQAWPDPYDEGLDSETRRSQFRAGHYPVAVYGLGKMGVPIAAVFASVTGRVIGVDIDQQRVDELNEGRCPIDGEPELPALVSESVETGSLAATTDGPQAAQQARIHVVIVPTLVHENGIPDLSALHSVIETIGDGLTRGDLVLIESTVPPTTSADVIHPSLVDRSDLGGQSFGLAVCPERTKSGQAVADITGTHPKIVGGVDEQSTNAAADLYREITTNAVIPVSDATTAECVKVFEGVYRDVNIALANELARFADELEVDVIEAIEVANTLPVCDLHTPGIGVGGHCIPYYPYFLIWPFETATPLIRTARSVNDEMAAFAVDRLNRGLTETGGDLHGARVAILGLTYRPGVRETSNSPARPVAKLCQNAGATVFTVDPLVAEPQDLPGQQVGIEDLYDLDLDAVVLVTAHDAFEGIHWGAFDDLVVVDGRGVLDLDGTSHHVYSIGRGLQKTRITYDCT